MNRFFLLPMSVVFTAVGAWLLIDGHLSISGALSSMARLFEVFVVGFLSGCCAVAVWSIVRLPTSRRHTAIPTRRRLPRPVARRSLKGHPGVNDPGGGGGSYENPHEGKDGNSSAGGLFGHGGQTGIGLNRGAPTPIF